MLSSGWDQPTSIKWKGLPGWHMRATQGTVSPSSGHAVPLVGRRRAFQTLQAMGLKPPFPVVEADGIRITAAASLRNIAQCFRQPMDAQASLRDLLRRVRPCGFESRLCRRLPGDVTSETTPDLTISQCLSGKLTFCYKML